jgi:hypothetical protein
VYSLKPFLSPAGLFWINFWTSSGT